jgi:hypothetical protein
VVAMVAAGVAAAVVVAEWVVAAAVAAACSEQDTVPYGLWDTVPYAAASRKHWLCLA